MKLLAILAVLSLDLCVTLAAPVPKVPLPETEAQKNSKLRAYYDQLQRDLGNTAEGQKLRGEVDRARTTAENVVTVERQLSNARQLSEADLAETLALERFYQRSLRLQRSPREEELFQLSLWEVRHGVKPRP